MNQLRLRLSDPVGSVPDISDETEATMPGDVNYFEIGSPDAPAAQAFYGGLTPHHPFHSWSGHGP